MRAPSGRFLPSAARIGATALEDRLKAFGRGSGFAAASGTGMRNCLRAPGGGLVQPDAPAGRIVELVGSADRAVRHLAAWRPGFRCRSRADGREAGRPSGEGGVPACVAGPPRFQKHIAKLIPPSNSPLPRAA